MSEKVGADDLITLTGATADDLQRLPRAATPATTPGAPEVAADGDDVLLTWDQYAVALRFGQLREATDGPQAELTVTLRLTGEVVHWGRLALASTSARETLVRKLGKVTPAPWRALLERACYSVALAIRAGEPVVPLVPSVGTTARWLVPKLVRAGETNLIFADGDSGKSWLALILAVSIASGRTLPAGLTPEGPPVPCLYLDWESTRDEHQARLCRLAEGFGLLEPPEIWYRRQHRPLADDAAFLRAEIRRRGIGFVAVDSLAPASGGGEDPTGTAITTMNAMRTFGDDVSRLVLAHVSKQAAEQSGPRRPFGSVFVSNLARNVWELRRSEEESPDLHMALYHLKCNALGGRRLPPFGLRLEDQGEATILHAHDLGHQPDLLARSSLAFRIQHALKSGSKTLEELAEATGGGDETVSRTLRRLRREGKVVNLDAARWGLPA